MRPRQPRSRKSAFALVCIAAVIFAAMYLIWSRSFRAPRADAVSEVAIEDHDMLARVQSRPYLLFRNTTFSPLRGCVAIVPLDNPRGMRYATRLVCERVDFSGERGVCLAADRGFRTTYRAVTFGSTFEPLHELPLPGVPSRVRISPTGRRAGLTVFVNGDSWANGSFSTRTYVVDTDTARVLGDLDQYTVWHAGRRIASVDFNFWGVTFADDRHIYATLGTGGHAYLIEADAETRTAAILHDNVECPSLSPDGSRIAFKRRQIVDGRLVFRLYVLDLATKRETAVAETRSVDDQIEWIDSEHVAYGLPGDTSGSTDVWVVSSDGTGSPTRLLEAAWSPAVIGAGDPPSTAQALRSAR